MATEFLLGVNAKLYRGAEDTALAALTLCDNVADLTLNLPKGTWDATTRKNAGYTSDPGALKSVAVEFTMVFEPGEADYEAMRDAYLDNSRLCLAILTGENDAEAEGPRGNFEVVNFVRNEPIAGGITINVTCNMVEFIEYVDEGGS